eukprot:4434229-Alexandrium_andersonii.AAC.1
MGACLFHPMVVRPLAPPASALEEEGDPAQAGQGQVAQMPQDGLCAIDGSKNTPYRSGMARPCDGSEGARG